MKPTFLSFCGINSFSERAEIDFEALLSFGIFGIFGDTGSGKSTILDCIGFALYGNVGRSRSGSIADIINYNAEKADVQFEFEIFYAGERRKYRVERELKRKNAAQSAKVFERDGESWRAVSDGVRESNAFLERVIGLEQKDFEKCIALPQGEFAQFVRAPRGDRLKLIARLFDLESYGDGLVRRAGAKVQAAKQALEVTDARLERYAAFTQAYLDELSGEVKTLTAQGSAQKTALAALRKEGEALAERVRRRKERDRVAERMRALEEAFEGMKTLSGELDRLDNAAAAVLAERDLQRCALRAAERAQAEQAAARALQRAEQTAAEAAAWDAERAEEAERALSERVARAKAQALALDELARANRQLREIERKLAAEREAFRGFSYDEEKAALEREEAALGKEDLVGFLETHAQALFRSEYAAFVKELQELASAHASAAADIAPLIEKYSRLAAGGRLDPSALRAAIEERETRSAALAEKKLALEQAKGRFDLHLQMLRELAASYEDAKARIGRLSGATETEEKCETLEGQLSALRAERARRTRQKEEAAKALAEARTAATKASAEAKAAADAKAEADARLMNALAAGAFSDAKEAEALAQKYGDPAAAKQRVEKFRDDWAATRRRLRELETEDLTAATDEAYAALREKLGAAEEDYKRCTETLAVCTQQYANAKKGLEERSLLEKARAAQEKEAALAERLRKLLEGNKFMEFAAEEYLQTVAANATQRLLSLTDGRYSLHYDKGFYVGDNFNGGLLRGVYTLSGGETFLVSLSLALALSAEICRKSLRPIEFFFLDEGFGTLDEHLVDVVMDSLEKLKSEHFSIGIISHVEELKHRIDRKLLVKKATERRGSQILAE